jgi:hemerythrin-like domain-containing protein
MANAIENLIDEHRLIERVLGSLETFCERMGEEPENDRATVLEYADFFHYFVDECHHGKEENHLFVRMNAYGFSKKAGPVSAMLSEQGEGREHLSALAEIGKGVGPLSKREQALVKGHSLGYITRIQSHMKREDEILFPVARHSLPAFVLRELAAEFESFEINVLTRDLHEKLLRTAEQLSTKYPPRLAKTVNSRSGKTPTDTE